MTAQLLHVRNNNLSVQISQIAATHHAQVLRGTLRDAVARAVSVGAHHVRTSRPRGPHISHDVSRHTYMRPRPHAEVLASSSHTSTVRELPSIAAVTLAVRIIGRELVARFALFVVTRPAPFAVLLVLRI